MDLQTIKKHPTQRFKKCPIHTQLFIITGSDKKEDMVVGTQVTKEMNEKFSDISSEQGA